MWARRRTAAPRRAQAQLLHRIFEIDPLLCPQCGAEMKVVSVITEPEVVDRILKHVARSPVQPGRRVVRGEVCPETSAVWTPGRWAGPWPVIDGG